MIRSTSVASIGRKNKRERIVRKRTKVEVKREE